MSMLQWRRKIFSQILFTRFTILVCRRINDECMLIVAVPCLLMAGQLS
jgi:hypothetical protein